MAFLFPDEDFFRRLGKNSICPKIQKLDFPQKKLDFSNSIWPFLHQKLAMNHKICPKKQISDLKTSKKAKTRLSNAKTWFEVPNTRFEMPKTRFEIQKTQFKMQKNSILKAKNSIFRHFTWVDSSAFAPKKSLLMHHTHYSTTTLNMLVLEKFSNNCVFADKSLVVRKNTTWYNFS